MDNERNNNNAEEIAEMMAKLKNKQQKDFIFGLLKGMVLSQELEEVKPDPEKEDDDQHKFKKAS